LYYFGVDGGGTKTAFVLIDQEGKICSYSIRSSCNYIQEGIENFQCILTEGLTDLCKEANITKINIAYSFLGLSSYGEIKEDVPTLKEIVKEILQSDRFQCGNDVEVAWAGSLACQPGINIVAGTGTIGFGKDKYGNSMRASGWDYLGGDEGSAYWLGKKVISLFEKQADARVARTRLYSIVRSKFNLKRDLDFISVIYNRLERKRDKIAGLALLLYQAAKEGDKKAIEIYKKAAFEYSLTIKALLKKLNFDSNEQILVSYSGSVFKAGAYVLHPLAKYLEKENVKLIEPILQPVTGAALYALLLDKKLNNYDSIVKVLKSEEKRLSLRATF